MVKDYFQDILPPESTGVPIKRAPAPQADAAEHDEVVLEAPERSIRSIQASPTRSRGGYGGSDVRETLAVKPPPAKSRLWMWAAVAVALLVLGAITLVALRPTSVTIVPRSHEVFFDDTAIFTAYPASSAATGTLTFVTQTQTFDQSELVAAAGVEHVEERASGSITIYNNYSSDAVTLIESTRFESPDGHVYRIPDEVIVPGRRGTTPGEISVVVFAEEPGEMYNAGPIERMSVPGLRSTPAMYSGIYASATSGFSGGYVGERPSASEADLAAARANSRTRVEEQVREMARSFTTDSTIALASLAQIRYENVAATTEGEGMVRVHERARVELPVFAADDFAHLIAQSVSADTEKGLVSLRPGEAFAATALAADLSSQTSLQFRLQGTATIVWRVDEAALREALAGRDEAAFEAIVSAFPGIQEAHARVQPFWKSAFPSDGEDITIMVRDNG